jgi:alkylation response protein AidB-like acyl-CoA dehydrogenase
MISTMGNVGVGGGMGGLEEYARETLGNGTGTASDAILRDGVVQIAMDAASFGLTLRRSADAVKAGRGVGPETSMFKYYGTELNKRRRELMVAMAGAKGLGWEGEGFTPDQLQVTRDWLRSKGNSIEGGTSEIQLNIIAKRVLGLPD